MRILYSPAKGKKKQTTNVVSGIGVFLEMRNGVASISRRFLPLVAYERARRALRGKCEPRAFGAVVRILYSDAKRKKIDHRMVVGGIGIFAVGEDFLALRLVSELPDLRAGNANLAPQRFALRSNVSKR